MKTKEEWENELESIHDVAKTPDFILGFKTAWVISHAPYAQQANGIKPLDYFRAGYKYYRSFVSKSEFDEGAEKAMRNAFDEFIALDKNIRSAS